MALIRKGGQRYTEEEMASVPESGSITGLSPRLGAQEWVRRLMILSDLHSSRKDGIRRFKMQRDAVLEASG